MRALRLWAATAAIGTGVWVGAALADGPPPSYPPAYAPVYAPTLTYDWTGIYVGGHIGGATTRSQWTFTNPATVSVDSLGQSDNGFVGGGHVGVQKQWGSLVVGAEVAYTWMDLEASSVSVDGVTSLGSSAKSVLLATGKLGFAYDTILAYFKGGYATGDVDYRTSGALVSSSHARESGWTAGAGLEYALWDHVILGVEYDYIRFTPGNRDQTLVGGGAVTGAAIDTQTVTGRLSFKFGGVRPELVPSK